MLRSRRQNGNLSREEFDAVATMSWFHLALEYDSRSCARCARRRTASSSACSRSRNASDCPAHGLAKNFFDIADPLSRFLIQIETVRTPTRPRTYRALYTRVTGGGPEADLRTIITHWTAITGHDVKARKVSTTSMVTV